MDGYPSPIARAVEISRRHFPAGTSEMVTALPVLLGPLLPAGQSARWRLSLLTDGGFPFEMTFSTAGDGPRYTLEVGPAGTPPGARLARSLELLANLGCEPAETGALELLARWQGRLQVAAVNSPAATVVSGDAAALAELSTGHRREDAP